LQLLSCAPARQFRVDMASPKDKKQVSNCAGISGDHKHVHTSTVEITRQVVSENGVVETVTETISSFDFYSCEEAIKRLNEYLDSELQPGEREDVIKHLQICVPCFERFQFEGTLLEAMRDRVRRSMAPQKLKEKLSLLVKNEEE